MKKALAILTAAIAMLSFLPTAFAASGSLSGPGTVRAGNTITITYYVSGTGITGADASVTYDTSKLTLTSAKKKIGGDWVVDFNNSAGKVKFVGYSNGLASPINKSTAVIAMTFKVSSSLAVGTAIQVTASGVASAGTGDQSIGGTYSKNIAAPLSSNNNLSALSVAGSSLDPAFSASKTSYTATIPFTAEKPTVTAKAADSGAKVKISVPDYFEPGESTQVKITCTAANGSAKDYMISVLREQDPNYIPSDDTTLSSLTVEGFLLSPAFDPAQFKYAVWLPYETTTLSFTATATFKRAKAEFVVPAELAVGENNIPITVTAENGDVTEYLLIVNRGEQVVSDVKPEPTQSLEPTESLEPTDVKNEPVSVTSPLWMVIVVPILALAAGSVGGFMFSKIGKIGKASKHSINMKKSK